jgi:hypothetical protein
MLDARGIDSSIAHTADGVPMHSPSTVATRSIAKESRSFRFSKREAVSTSLPSDRPFSTKLSLSEPLLLL